MKVAVIWSRFGPYHLARLRGAADIGNALDAEVVGMEVAQKDDIYEWEVSAGAQGFERRTLFPNRNYHSLSHGEINRAVATALDVIRPDAVAINGWSVPEARCALDWCTRHSGAKLILMSETKEDDSRRVWWKETVKMRLLRHCDAALVGGRMQAAYLCRLGFAESRIFLGYDVVDNAYFSRAAVTCRSEENDKQSGLKLPKKYFFACTRFLPRKNVDGLLMAYAQYRQHCTEDPWGLVIAGSGEESDKLRDIGNALQLKGVVWLGFVQYDALPAYFGSASAFIHPAKSEPWGLVVNEAAASGLPLLVSKSVGARYELVQEGENGFLFDPWDTADMARTLIRMSQCTADDRVRMGARSEDVISEWAPDRFGKQLFAAIGAVRRVTGCAV